MALDGILLHLLCDELDALREMRIEKIYQPTRDELVLLLRSAGKSCKLLLSAKLGYSRIALIDEAPENPAEPPTFCKLLRKHIGGAKITAIEQQGLDRTIFIRLSCYNEMGDPIQPFLAVELFSNRSNIILCDEKARIIDAVRRTDIESGGRMILPGATYHPLPPQLKLNPFNSTEEEMALAVCQSGKALSSAFMAAIEGISPLISRELASLSRLDDDLTPTPNDKEEVVSVLKKFKEIILSKHSPCHLLLEDNSADFTYMPITQYGDLAEIKGSASYNTLLCEFYSLRDRQARIKSAAQDIFKLLTNLKARAERRLSTRISELEKSRDRDRLLLYGELLKANLYAVRKGDKSVVVSNYYDPELATVEIPLNETLSPSENASNFFKDYKRAHTAEKTLTQLIENDKNEILYLESVLDSLSRTETLKDLSSIREELYEAGYIFRSAKAKRPLPTSEPKEYTSPDGFLVAVGRNNRENDALTLKRASKDDIWLHTKDIPGSHVIIFTEGRAVPETTLVFAARLAAKNSKAADGSNVAVDTTLVKYVKKPSGAKPGMVIYTHNRTLYVTP